jgi:hypothetical protein
METPQIGIFLFDLLLILNGLQAFVLGESLLDVWLDVWLSVKCSFPKERLGFSFQGFDVVFLG